MSVKIVSEDGQKLTLQVTVEQKALHILTLITCMEEKHTQHDSEKRTIFATFFRTVAKGDYFLFQSEYHRGSAGTAICMATEHYEKCFSNPENLQFLQHIKILEKKSNCQSFAR